MSRHGNRKKLQICLSGKNRNLFPALTSIISTILRNQEMAIELNSFSSPFFYKQLK